MNNRRFIRNYLYNSLYQVLLIITPIITTPYISRVLGVDYIGTSSYTMAVAQIFYIIGSMGVFNYGSRAIAYVRESRTKVTEEFWNIWFIQFVFGILSLIIYYLLFIRLNILGFYNIFFIQVFIVLGAIFDISWLYVGVEDFKKNVTRNIAVKIGGIICIFIFVKNQNDFYKYIIINSVSTFLGMISLWMFLFEYVEKFKIKYIKKNKHLKGTFILLIPQLAIQIYTSLDRTIIGNLSDITQVGFYDQSQKLARISLAIVTSLSTVLMPKIANLYAVKKLDKIEKYLKKSLHFTVALACLIITGIVSISNEFVPIFFGEDFIDITLYVKITSLIIIFIPLGGVFANQFALPTNKNKEYIIPLVFAAIINVILNIVLVPKLGALGGVLSIIITELLTMILRILLVRKYLHLKDIIKGIYIYFIACIVSISLTNFIAKVLSFSSFLLFFIKGIICVIIYIYILYVSDNIIRDEIIKIIKNKKVI